MEWRRYGHRALLLETPPDSFEEVGHRMIAFLKPIRDSSLSHESFKLTWIAGDAWQGLASAEML